MTKHLVFCILLLSACSPPSLNENLVQRTAESRTATQEPSPEPLVVKQKSDRFNIRLPKDSWVENYFEEIDKRANLSKLSNLRRKALPKGDIEVRVWDGFGLTLLEGFVLKRSSGEWAATDLSWRSTGNRGNRNAIEDRKLDPPKSGWEEAWQKLEALRVLTLPDAAEIECGGGARDGSSYVVEYNADNEYRTYMYDNPQYAECHEAKNIQEIVNLIGSEYGGLREQ